VRTTGREPADIAEEVLGTVPAGPAARPDPVEPDPAVAREPANSGTRTGEHAGVGGPLATAPRVRDERLR
jgi:hypothetical protein